MIIFDGKIACGQAGIRLDDSTHNELSPKWFRVCSRRLTHRLCSIRDHNTIHGLQNNIFF
jgi:hypothetical protein